MSRGHQVPGGDAEPEQAAGLGDVLRRLRRKVERYHRTVAREWAYRQAWSCNDDRAGALAGFVHRYNYHRPHTALNGKPPRLPHAGRHHLSGFNS
jgi:hypothetical protein